MKRKIPLLSHLVGGSLLALLLLIFQQSFAKDIIPLKSDKQRTEKGKERPRMPARPIMGHYDEGVFSVPEWPWLDETAHLTIVTADGAVAADLDCSGTDIATGIYIGCFDSFAVTITTDSGITLTGAFLPGQ